MKSIVVWQGIAITIQQLHSLLVQYPIFNVKASYARCGDKKPSAV